MNLPDFRSDEGLQDVLKAVNAVPLDMSRFKLERNWLNDRHPVWYGLNFYGLVLNRPQELALSKEGYFLYEGRPVVAYLLYRDRTAVASPLFHLTWCPRLQRSAHDPRSAQRIVISRDQTGFLPYYKVSRSQRSRGWPSVSRVRVRRHRACRHCLALTERPESRDRDAREFFDLRAYHDGFRTRASAMARIPAPAPVAVATPKVRWAESSGTPPTGARKGTDPWLVDWHADQVAWQYVLDHGLSCGGCGARGDRLRIVPEDFDEKNLAVSNIAVRCWGLCLQRRWLGLLHRKVQHKVGVCGKCDRLCAAVSEADEADVIMKESVLMAVPIDGNWDWPVFQNGALVCRKCATAEVVQVWRHLLRQVV